MAAPGPFATIEPPSDRYPDDFHMISRKTEVTEKAGVGGFDQNVYLANRAANQHNLALSKARNNAPGGTPYSLHNLADGSGYEAKEFHLQHQNKGLPDKIGTSGTFDVEDYRQARAGNLARAEELKHKRHGSAAAAGGVGGNSGSGCPFATSSAEECREQWARTYTAKSTQHKELAGKIGAAKTFNPTTYSDNLAANQQQQKDSLARSYVGSGDILAFNPAAAGGGASSRQRR